MAESKLVYSFLAGDIKDFPIAVNPGSVMFGTDPRCQFYGWRFINVSDLVHSLGPYDVNKIVKWSSNILFPEMNYCLYHDGNIQADINHLLQFIEASGKDMCFFAHPDRNCVYDEALELLIVNKGNRECIHNIIDHYAKAGFPKNIGLPGTGICAFSHSPRSYSFSKLVLETYLNLGGYRDQLAFPIAMLLEGYKIEDLTGLGKLIPGDKFVFIDTYKRNDSQYSKRSQLRSNNYHYILNELCRRVRKPKS